MALHGVRTSSYVQPDLFIRQTPPQIGCNQNEEDGVRCIDAGLREGSKYDRCSVFLK